MGETLSLFDYGSSSAPHEISFVLFQKKTSAEDLYYFSPDVMQLTDDIFAADLSHTLSFWKKKAQLRGWTERDLWRACSQSVSELTVFCSHPFQGLLFFNSLSQRGVNGCFFTDTIFAKKNYQHLSWHIWLQSARQMQACYEQNHRLVRERKNFSSILNRFERFLNRMNLAQIEDLQSVEFFQLQRRFGSFFGTLWSWTFQAERTFLWNSYQQNLLPQKKTWLETPSSHWQQIFLDLQRDVEVLSSDASLQKSYYVTGLVWNLICYDGETQRIEISFPHPLNLSQPEHQEAALKQLSFAFEKVGREWSQAQKDGEVTHLGVVMGWELSVAGKIQVRSETLSLFSEVRFEQKSMDESIVLQSKIQSPIRHYASELAHVPGLDFKELSLNETADTKANDKVKTGLRPLFIFPEPKPIEPDEILQKRFLERVSSCWWQSQKLEDQWRDYYICQLKDGHWVWCYQNFSQDWYWHGLYS